MMSAIMSDLIEGTLDPRTAAGTVSAGGKMLQAASLQLRFGGKPQDTTPLLLSPES